LRGGKRTRVRRKGAPKIKRSALLVIKINLLFAGGFGDVELTGSLEAALE
jgi:hypothetical protein